jgi:osmotically-inducible protein OsmY
MKTRLITAAIVAGMVTVPFTAHAADTVKKDSPKESVGEFVDDATITTKVKAEMAKDKAVSATNIKVETTKGVVQLSGNAKTKAEAEQAVAIAKSTKGVTSVRNDIQIGTM